MSIKKGFTLVLFLVGTGACVLGQNRFWIAGATGNWNDPANWSTTSGGAGGASVPGAGNAAIFNANGLGNCNLDIAPTVGGITVNGYTGTIDLTGNNLTTTGTNLFTTGTISNSGGAAAVTLNTTVTTTFNGTLFNANVNGSTGRLYFSGSTFNGTVTVTKTDNNLDVGAGGNIFNNSLTISSAGTGELRLGNTNPDSFSTLTINLNNTGNVSLARISAGNVFNENITINYNSTGDVFVGAAGGTSSLQTGKIISIGAIGGAGSGNLSLAQFTQNGGTAQAITLSGNNTSTLTIGPASSFAASLTVVAPSIILNSSSFQALTLTKTGTVTSDIRGGNTFNGVFIVNNQGGDMFFGSNAADAGDTWNANATFNNTGGYRLRVPEQTSGNIFNAAATFNNTSATDVQNRIQISRLAGAEVTFNGTTTFFNNGNASDIHISYDVGTSTTFNGPVIYTNSATTSAAQNYIGVNGNVTFANDLQITNNTSDNIYLSQNTGLVSFGNGTITIGAFAAGTLRFRNFTQTGATAQTFSLTGTASLYLGPASTFTGNVNLSAPQLYLNGCSYGGSATLEKTGATDNNSTGGNIFNGITIITNSGSGELALGNGTADQFNASTTFNNTGSYRFLVADNHNGQTTTFASDVVFNTNKTGGADGWSYLVSENPNSHLSFGGNVTINCAGTLQSNHRFLQGAGSSATYAGTVTINITNTHASTSISMGVNGPSTYNDNIVVSNSGGSAGISFNTGASGSSTLAATRTITIGAGGFSSGTLGLLRFTQTGATPQTLTAFSGTANLTVGPVSVFDGDVDFRAPQVYLNGCTYGGTATIEKTGATSNAGSGGNIFTGVATITNSGSGYLLTGNGNRDQFLSNAIFNNTGSYRIYFAHNHPGQTTTFAGDLTLNSNKSAGTDAYSFLVGENGTSALLVSGTLAINCGGAIQSIFQFLNGVGSSAVFNGATNINCTNTNSGTTLYMGMNGTSTFNGNIAVANSGGANGIIFNNGASSSSVLNGSISSGVFSSGSLNLYRFSQVGAFAQNLTLTSSAILRVGPNSSFDGQVNFISPRILLNGAAYNGVTSLEKTGANNDAGNGGNTFNNTTDLINSGSGYLMIGNVSADIFNGPLTITNTSSSLIYLAYNSPGNQFNNSIVVNNTGSAQGISFSENALGSSILSAGNTISVGGSGFTTGQLSLYRFSQDGATAQNITLSGTALLRLGPSSEFDGDVTFVSPRVLLNGTTYNGAAYIEKSSTTPDDGTGGNVFNGTTEIVNSGDSYLRTSNVSPDIFNGLLVLTNNGASTIRMADNAAGNQFNGNIELNSTFGGGIYFGNNTLGTSTLAAGRTISVGSSGVISGDIRLIRFTQVGPTLQTLDLSGVAILTLGPTSSFGGDVDFSAPQLYLNGTTFSGTASLEKEGATDNASNGGNTFNGTTTIINSGSGYLLTAYTTADIFNGNLTVTNTGSSTIYLAHNVGGNQFNGDITFNSTLGSGGISFAATATGDATLGNGASLNVGGLGFSSGVLRFRRFTQIGNAAQTLLLTGTALLEIGPSSTFNGDVDFRSPQFELDGCTYNGTTYLEKTGAANNSSNGGNDFNGTTTIANSGSGYFRFAVTTLDTFDGDLILTNTGTSSILMADVVPGTMFNGNIEVNCTSGVGIFFGDNPPANATLAAGKTISVGATGFTIGELRLDRFTQLGATPQTLLLTGTAQLTVGPSTQFNGNADFRSPQLFLSGGTFNGTAHLEKTGASNSTGSGSNTFNGLTTIINNGTGVLRTNGGNTFNGTTTITNNGTADILLELTTASTYNGDVTFTNTNISSVRVAYMGATSFNGNIQVNSTAGGGINFCEDPTGSVTLANTKTISVGGTGFSAGTLRLRRFTQTGGTAQSLLLTGTSTLHSGPTVTFNGDMTTSSPGLLLDGTTFNGTTNSITKTGASTDNSPGNNIFNGNTTFTNSGTGIFRFAVTTADTYNGSATFVRSNGTIQPAYNNVNIVNGDLSTNSSTAISFGANNGSITFSGGSSQTINKIAGASPVFSRITMDKTANDLTLNTDISVTINGTFTTGIINTTAVNLLNFANNATVTGGVDASYVDGPVRKTGDDAFTFPVGDNGFYRPVSISAPTGVAHYFTAQYFNANHNLGSPAVWDPTFWTVTGCEYWVVDRNTAPTSNVFVTLSWNELACNPGYITNPADLRVTRWNGTNWVDHGNGGTTGTPTNGTIISSAAITSFSPITLASVSAANPLPIELAWFKASLTAHASVLLEWQTESELNNDSFDVERSQDGFDFTKIATLRGAGTTSQSHYYSTIDEQPLPGVSYYRLKQTDFDGTSTYSYYISVTRDGEPFSAYPNPAGKEFVKFNRKVNAVVINNLNQVVGRYNAATGFNTQHLTPGVYTIRIQTGEVFRLVIN
ncbi:MAG: T9SS type A sorting domain-containing protein [Cyclobacteriaceae bacterium]